MLETVDYYISGDNLVNLFDLCVDSLDIAKLGFRHFCMEEGTARSSYDPSDLLKPYL